jgi:hypothetical protein
MTTHAPDRRREDITMTLAEILIFKANEAERTRSMVVGPSLIVLLREAAAVLIERANERVVTDLLTSAQRAADLERRAS